MRISLPGQRRGSQGAIWRLWVRQAAGQGVATRTGPSAREEDNHRVMKTTVLIVDDHAGFRASARRVLEAEGFEVVGEAADGESGIVSARSLRPEIVLLDVQLPGIDGFSVARELSGDQAAPAVVLTSSRSGSDFGSLVAESGARGFVSKSALSGPALRGLIG